ncbi:MAG: metallophosphoesterase family protein [Bdellovibrionales bacterium]|nr:metallophosphoesterase family protein [Bdellovibrionales bacterium]
MKILGVVDIHSKHERIPDLLWEAEDADLVLIAGDITNFGDRTAAQEVLDPILDRCQSVFAVSGNCDRPAVDEYLIERKIAVEDNPQCLEVDGMSIGIFGMGGSLPCPGTTPHEHSEEEFRTCLRRDFVKVRSCDRTIGIIHQPAHRTEVDRSLLAGHVGSIAVRECIEELQPTMVFSGHIHESRGEDTIGQTALVNPGPFLKGYYFSALLTPDSLNITMKQL